MIESHEVLRREAAKAAIVKMWSSGWFDICTIDKIGKMFDLHPSGAAYNILSTLHCVHFRDMSPALRDSLPDLIRQCLASWVVDDVPYAEQSHNSEPQKAGLWNRLLGLK